MDSGLLCSLPGCGRHDEEACQADTQLHISFSFSLFVLGGTPPPFPPDNKEAKCVTACQLDTPQYDYHHNAVVSMSPLTLCFSMSTKKQSAPGGLLHKHLNNLRFTVDATAKRGAAVVVKRRSGTSGTPGNQTTPPSKIDFAETKSN